MIEMSDMPIKLQCAHTHSQRDATTHDSAGGTPCWVNHVHGELDGIDFDQDRWNHCIAKEFTATSLSCCLKLQICWFHQDQLAVLQCLTSLLGVGLPRRKCTSRILLAIIEYVWICIYHSDSRWQMLTINISFFINEPIYLVSNSF